MKRPLCLAGLILSAAAILQVLISGAVSYPGISNKSPGNVVLSYEEEWDILQDDIIVKGKVLEKEIRKQYQYFIIQIDLNSQKSIAAIPQQILFTLKQMKTDRLQCYPAADGAMPGIGSSVTVRGKFGFFPEATNPGEFDKRKFNQGQRIGGRLNQTEILEGGEKGNPVAEALFRCRAIWGKRLDAIFPEKEAGVLRAMLLGDRSLLDSDLKEMYQKSGIIHILSISGVHISLLGMGIYRLLRKIGIKTAVSAAIAFCLILSYGVMTGLSVSACRAIGMFGLRMLSLTQGRTYDLPTALCVLAAGMLCRNPLYVLQSGFWLSFGALAGVSCILPVFEEIRGMLPGDQKPGASMIERMFSRLREGIAAAWRAGISVFLATMPLQLMFNFEVSISGLFLNLAVIPLMGIVTLCGFSAMLIPGLEMIGVVDVVILRGFEFLCRSTQALPLLNWNPGQPRLWQIFGYYLLLALILLGERLYIRQKKKGRAELASARLGSNACFVRLRAGRRKAESASGKPGSCLWYRVCLLLPVLLLALPVHRMDGFVFLDVGQGDSILIRTVQGNTWIYDCGSSSKKNVGENILIPYLKREGIHRIDGIFLSHGDLDHMSGLLELLQEAQKKQIEIQGIFLPDLKKEQKILEFGELLHAAGEIPVVWLSEGEMWQAGNVCFLVLHPGRDFQTKKRLPEEGGSNENSLCLYVEVKERGHAMTALLTGDVEGEGERHLIEALGRYGIEDVSILKCAHHGSKNATSENFLDTLDADLTVISCGQNNVYGHPHKEVLDRLESIGCVVRRTDQSGCITVSVSGKKISVTPFRK